MQSTYLNRSPDSYPLLSPSNEEFSIIQSNLAFQVNSHRLSHKAAGSVKKSPMKYSYLRSNEEQEQRRQSQIFWLQSFSTFIFILTSTCSKPTLGTDLYFLVGILMAIPICVKQTGANLNPAVTYSMTFKSSNNSLSYLNLLWIYVKAQICGSLLAMFFAVMLNDVARGPLYPTFEDGDNSLQYLIVIGRIIVSEAIGVFILIVVILYGTGPYSFLTTIGAKYIYIAVFVYIGRKFAASSSNQINLALTLSQAAVGLHLCDFQGFRYFIAWVVGDLLGVIVGGYFYTRLVEPTLDYLEKHKTKKEALARLHSGQQTEMKITSTERQEPDNIDDLFQNKDYYKKLEYF